MRAGGFSMVEDEGAWMDFYDVIFFVEKAQHCYQERAVKLVRDALDSGQVGPRVEVLKEDVLRLWEEGKQPPPAQKTVPKRARPVQEGVLEAIGALWPNGIPRSLRSKERDNKIYKWLNENEKSVSLSFSSLERAVQRVLKEHPKLLQNDAGPGRISKPGTRT
jgi:hypothetical protein